MKDSSSEKCKKKNSGCGGVCTQSGRGGGRWQGFSCQPKQQAPGSARRTAQKKKKKKAEGEDIAQWVKALAAKSNSLHLLP